MGYGLTASRYQEEKRVVPDNLARLVSRLRPAASTARAVSSLHHRDRFGEMGSAMVLPRRACGDHALHREAHWPIH